jgi:protein subunit release factor A
MPKGSNPKSRKNLEKAKRFTVETASEMGRKGAIASNAKQAKARTFAEELKALLEIELTNSNGQKVSTRAAISTALIKKAMAGDRGAFAEIRDTVGEKPIEQVETTIKEPRRFVFELKK